MESIKDKVKSSFKDILVEAILEVANKILHVEKNEDGKLGSLKISKELSDGTVFELELKINPQNQHSHDEHEEKSSKKTKDK